MLLAFQPTSLKYNAVITAAGEEGNEYIKTLHPALGPDALEKLREKFTNQHLLEHAKKKA